MFEWTDKSGENSDGISVLHEEACYRTYKFSVRFYSDDTSMLYVYPSFDPLRRFNHPIREEVSSLTEGKRIAHFIAGEVRRGIL